MECGGFIRIMRAFDLPRTDRMSKIDAYVVVSQGGRVCGRTRAVDDNENPVWEQVVPVFMLRGPDGRLSGSIELQLFDENTFKDKLVGHAMVDLATLSPQQLAHTELKWSPNESKFADSMHNSRVAVSIIPGIVTYRALRSHWGSVPGVIAVDAKQRIYIPIADPHARGALYLGVEYEHTEVDFKLFVTVPGTALYVDMCLAGRPQTKVRRRQYPAGEHVAPGLVVYQEIKLDDVPVTTDFNSVQVLVHDASYISGTNAAQVVKAHGWQGSLNYERACHQLVDIDVDRQEKEIYMSVDVGETLLLVDWDEDDVDVKLAVLANPATLDKAYDLTIKGQTCKKVGEIFLPPKPAIGGKYHIARIFELDDVKYGSSFSNMEIHRLQLSNTRVYSVQMVTRIMG